MNVKLLIIALCLTVGLVACPSLRNGPPPTPEEALVFAPQTALLDTEPPQSFILVPPEVIPQKVADAFSGEQGAPVVLTTVGALKPGARHVAIEGVDLRQHEDLLAWLQNPALQSVITSIFPQAAGLLAGIELLLALFFPRKRQHYATAAKAVLSGSPKMAGASFLKALGARHTEETQKPEDKAA